jgi:hypothetical protein
MAAYDWGMLLYSPRPAFQDSGHVLQLDGLTMVSSPIAFFDAFLRGTWSYVDHMLAGPPIFLLAMLSREHNILL